MLSLILAESALELVPKELQHHNSVVSHSSKIEKYPSEILLDNSWHFAAMKGIENEIKRGRPDLVHISLLEACTIPLYFENKIKVYVHTIDDKVITIGKNVRLPKSYHRFARLIEQLYIEKSIQSADQMLLEISDMNFKELIDKIKPKKTIGLSTQGNPSSYDIVAEKLNEDTCLVIGAFQKGHFSDKIINQFNDMMNIDKESLDAHVVISRVLYEYEKTIFM